MIFGKILGDKFLRLGWKQNIFTASYREFLNYCFIACFSRRKHKSSAWCVNELRFSDSLLIWKGTYEIMRSMQISRGACARRHTIAAILFLAATSAIYQDI